MRTRTSPLPNGGNSFSLMDVSLSVAALDALAGSDADPADWIFVRTRHLVVVGKEEAMI